MTAGLTLIGRNVDRSKGDQEGNVRPGFLPPPAYLRLPVPRPTQERARELIRQGSWEAAINEIRAAAGYDRRDARCVALTLAYAWKLPTSRFPRPRHSPAA